MTQGYLHKHMTSLKPLYRLKTHLMLPTRLLLDLPSEYFPRGNHIYAYVQTIKNTNTRIILAAKAKLPALMFLFTCGLSKFKAARHDNWRSKPVLISNYSERTDHSKIVTKNDYNTFYFRFLKTVKSVPYNLFQITSQ